MQGHYSALVASCHSMSCFDGEVLCVLMVANSVVAA